jgi:subtilisin family serine protease
MTETLRHPSFVLSWRSVRTRTHRSRQWRLAGLILSAVLLSQLVATAPFAAAARPVARAKVAPTVLTATAEGRTAAFLVVMAEQADVSAAAQLAKKQAKGRYVFDVLTGFARRSQADIRAFLDSQNGQHVTYKSYYIANMLLVTGGQDLALRLAARPDVSQIVANPRVRVPLPTQPDAVHGPESRTTIEWNIAQVNADDVWALGYTGQGTVVANADTGVQWDHSALRNHYRGWNGTSADHNFNWWDVIQGTAAPLDPHGHGSHTTGTMIGDDGAGAQIGVAPGATWIACRNLDAGGFGSLAGFVECMEFLLAPWDLNHQNANPDLAPDTINNSWYCTPAEGCTDPNALLTPVANLRAAGILVAGTAGGGGPVCSTIADPPGIYDPTTTLGATTASDALATFSARGPVTRDGSGRIKPDLSAPGVSVRSSVPPNGYAIFSGASMATPHLAGAVALLWSARPWLRGNVDMAEYYLFQGTFRNLPAVSACGGTPYNIFPNNMYGWGRLDILQTVNIVPIIPTAVELTQFSSQSSVVSSQIRLLATLVALVALSLLGGALIRRQYR